LVSRKTKIDPLYEFVFSGALKRRRYTAMSHTVLEIVKKHRVFYEVLPYYVQLEERPPGNTSARRKVLAGFEVDVYGARTREEHGPETDYRTGYAALMDVVEKVLRLSTDSCVIEVISSGSGVFLDPRSGFQRTLRVRITHGRGLDQPAGAPEERALKGLQEELRDLGINQGKPRA